MRFISFKKYRFGPFQLLIVRLLVVLLLYGFSRWLFYIFNLHSFEHLGFIELIRIMVLGIRFDLAAIALTNLPLILLMTIPFAFRYKSWYQLITSSIYIVINAFALMFNLVDVIFFRYIAKRTTSEVFEFFRNTNENQGLLMKEFFFDFWYMLLIFSAFIYVLFLTTKFFLFKNPWPVRKTRWYSGQFVLWILSMGLMIIFARGGFQLKPIGLIAAAKYTESRNVPLLINSPFSVLKTFGSTKLTERHYFDQEALNQQFNPEQSQLQQNVLPDSVSLKGFNVVMIMIESLSRNYIGYYTPRAQSLTPFLDSLLNMSITFDGFANGKRSIEALPSILGGIPSLMNMDYATSPYINNKLVGLGSVLKSNGYSTSFFHGGNNGTMGFDVFSSIAGFDSYFGRNEYANDADFDQQWGIFDEPFLQFTASQLNKQKQPFAAGIFTLSSHHPYVLPQTHKESFPHAKNMIEQTFCYLDYSLHRFFNSASKMPWYNRTVFIITADHTPEQSHSSSDRKFLNLYAVPIAFYIPALGRGIKTNEIAQHTDIFPSTVALLELDNAVFAFGRNLFDSNQSPFIINYLSGIFKLVDGNYFLLHNEEQALELYDISIDPSMTMNIVETNETALLKTENKLKAIIQQYNNRMIHNKLYVESMHYETNNAER